MTPFPPFSLSGLCDVETISLLCEVEIFRYGLFLPQPLRWYLPLQSLALVGMFYAERTIAGKVYFPH